MRRRLHTIVVSLVGSYILACFLLPSKVSAITQPQLQLDYLSVASLQVGAGFSSTSVAHTIGTGPNTNLYCFNTQLGPYASSNAPTWSIGSQTFNLTPATFGTPGWQIQGWSLVNPTPGTGTINVSWSPNNDSSGDASTLTCMSMFNADPINPFNVSAGASSGTSVSVTTTKPLCWIVSGLTSGSGVVVPNSGIQMLNQSGGFVTTTFTYVLQAAQGSNTMTFNQSAGTTHSIASFAINPITLTQTPAQHGLLHGNISALRYNAAPVSTVSNTFYQGTASGGDTNYTTLVSSAVLPGAYFGGAIIGTWNDATAGMGCATAGGSDICMYQVLTYNPATGAATYALINAFTSAGVTNGDCLFDTAGTPKTRSPFSMNGRLYISIGCLKHGTFEARQWGIFVSCDGGATWSNYATYTANGNTCAGGTADGNFPTASAAGFQWTAATNNVFGALSIVDFMCGDQDNPNCPVAVGVDPTYVYFMSSPGAGIVYISRLTKTGDPMLAGLQVYTGGAGANATWSSTSSNAMSVQTTNMLNAGYAKMQYLKEYGVFFVWVHGGGSTITTAYSNYPWGPWVQGTPMVVPDSGYQFPSAVPGLGPRHSGGHTFYTLFMNGVASGRDLYIREADLGASLIPYAGVH